MGISHRTASVELDNFGNLGLTFGQYQGIIEKGISSMKYSSN
jgi:hypothetical protein